MNFGLSTVCFKDYSPRDLVKLCVPAGITNLEIWDHDGYFAETRIPPREIRTILADAGMVIHSLHAPYGEVDEDYPEPFLAQFRRSCEKAHILGAGYTVIHPVKSGKEAPATGVPLVECMPKALSLWRTLAAIAGEHGLGAAFENLPPGAQWPAGCPLEVVAEIVRMTGQQNAGICLDISHCFTVNQDAALILESQGPLAILGIHASDGIHGQFDDKHLPPGSGELHWGKTFRALSAKNFDGQVNLEVKNLPEDPRVIESAIRFLKNKAITVGGVINF